MNWKKIVGILIALAVVGFIGYSVLGSNEKEEVATVRTGRVTEQTITETLNTTGIIEPVETQEVFGQGIISELPVEVGDSVGEGDELIAYMNGTSLTANFDGTVVAVNGTADESDISLQTGQPTVALANLTDLQVAVNLGRSDAVRIEEGQSVLLTSEEEEVEGTVSHVDPIATQSAVQTGVTSTLGAIITFDSGNENLIAGFDIDVEVTTNTAENALALPIEALLYNQDNEPFVYVMEDGTAREVVIQTGIQTDSLVEVTDGLTSGKTVILSPDESISDGLAVTAE